METGTRAEKIKGLSLRETPDLAFRIVCKPQDMLRFCHWVSRLSLILFHLKDLSLISVLTLQRQRK